MVADVSQVATDGPTWDTVTVTTTVHVAGHSWWLRIRPVAGGEPQLGFIDGDDILAALKRAGVKIAKDATILQTHQLRVDHATGGLIAFDVHNDVLFVLDPED